MTKEEAKEYWTVRYEAARNWDDPHWEASERKDHRRYVDALKAAIEALSERTGEWIFEETDEYKRTYCSVCGGSAPFVIVPDDYYGRRFHGETRKPKFCPNCGADMRGKIE